MSSSPYPPVQHATGPCRCAPWHHLQRIAARCRCLSLPSVHTSMLPPTGWHLNLAATTAHLTTCKPGPSAPRQPPITTTTTNATATEAQGAAKWSHAPFPSAPDSTQHQTDHHQKSSAPFYRAPELAPPKEPQCCSCCSPGAPPLPYRFAFYVTLPLASYCHLFLIFNFFTLPINQPIQPIYRPPPKCLEDVSVTTPRLGAAQPGPKLPVFFFFVADQ